MTSCIRRFGIRIGDRKYLNEYTPFGSVSLWIHYRTYTWTYTEATQAHFFVEKRHLVAEMSVDVLKNFLKTN